MKNRAAGMTFLDACIVLIFITLVISVAVPAYRDRRGARLMRELIVVAEERASAIEQAVAHQHGLRISQLDAGSLGIPADVPVDATQHGVEVSDGRIVVTWKQDSSFLAGVTYELELASLTKPLDWRVGGSCHSLGICQDSQD